MFTLVRADDMQITEIKCKTALSKSNLSHLTYALNPYRGCEHGCIYCYAPAVLRETRIWGSFVDVKINIAEVLSKETKKLKKGTVGIGTVTDAYQPLEKKYELTRKCLTELLKYDFPICIQTKSSLVLRDLDIIKQFSKKDIGITVTTADDEIRMKYEPHTSSVEEKFSVLKKFADEGIDTWMFLGPVMPYITDRNNDLQELIKLASECNVKKIIIDRLRLKPGLWKNINEFLEKHYPELIQNYKEALGDDSVYFRRVFSKIDKLCSDYKIKCEHAF
ncbi:MAG: radical SAM protein [Thermoplasmata archaeon]